MRAALLVMRKSATLVSTLSILSACPGAAAEPTSASSLTLVTPDEPGTELTVNGTVVDDKGQPIAGAQLHVYQTDVTGRYTRERAMDEAHARLAGRLRSDEKGRFEVRTIRPGGYQEAVRIDGSERKIPAHIHIDVTAAGYAPRRAQAVFADDPLLADPYWRAWVRRLGHPVLAIRPVGDGAAADLRIVLRP